MRSLLCLLLTAAALIGMMLPAGAADQPQPNLGAAWYCSTARTETVAAGDGYFSLRMVQAQVSSSRPSWLRQMLFGDRGDRDAVISLRLDYDTNGILAPVAWGQVAPGQPWLPQSQLQCTPWLPVVTRVGAPIEPRITVLLRNTVRTQGGALPVLNSIAQQATASAAMSGLTTATAPYLLYQDLFERVFRIFTHKETPVEATFELASGSSPRETNYARYFLVTDVDSRLERTRLGRRESFPWQEWEQHLAVPGPGSANQRVVWADSGEPVLSTSFVLFEVRTLPHFITDLNDLTAAAGLYKTIDKLVLAPLTAALIKTDPADEELIRDLLSQHLTYLREWLYAEQSGLSIRDIQTICDLVGKLALKNAGISTKGIWTLSPGPQAPDFTLPGASFPVETRIDGRPPLHHY